MEYLAFGAQFAVAGVFIIAGVGKARTMDDTVAMVQELLSILRISAGSVLRPAAWVLVVVELLTGVAILGRGVVAVAGLLAAAALLLGFTTLAVASARGQLNLRCACFGKSSARLGWRHVWRNLALLSITVAGLGYVAGEPAGPLELGGIAIAVVAAGVVILLAVFFDDLADVVTSSRK